MTFSKKRGELQNKKNEKIRDNQKVNQNITLTDKEQNAITIHKCINKIP